MPIYRKLQSIVAKVDPSTGYDTAFDKPYLFLLTPVDGDDEESGEWLSMRGRKIAYESLREKCLSGMYKLTKSWVLSGGITFGNEVSIYTFLRQCIVVYRYGTQDDLDMINATIMDIDPSITEEYLDRLYTSEIYSSPK